MQPQPTAAELAARVGLPRIEEVSVSRRHRQGLVEKPEPLAGRPTLPRARCLRVAASARLEEQEGDADAAAAAPKYPTEEQDRAEGHHQRVSGATPSLSGPLRSGCSCQSVEKEEMAQLMRWLLPFQVVVPAPRMAILFFSTSGHTEKKRNAR